MKKIRLRVREANGWWEKGIGLINKEPESLLFRTRFGIHTFGMSYPIDVIVLDTNHCVVQLQEALQPNRVFLWSFRYAIVIELPQGTISHMKIHPGDTIMLA